MDQFNLKQQQNKSLCRNIQKCSDIKTPAPGFDFETLFIQRSQSLLENLFVAVSFDIVADRHK